jgi:hypothetical protein
MTWIVKTSAMVLALVVSVPAAVAAAIYPPHTRRRAALDEGSTCPRSTPRDRVKSVRLGLIWALAIGRLCLTGSARTEPALLVESRIALPAVSGRIDHMAIDLTRKRLFVAELGNGILDVVDLAAGRQTQRLSRLAEAQGVGYAQTAGLVVANGGDGSVWFYGADLLASAGTVPLGGDADNVRIGPRTGGIVVGYGSGGLALIDAERRPKIGDIRLAEYPEGFAIDPSAERAYVNVPDAGQIAVVLLIARKQIASWAVSGLRASCPMALDAAGATLGGCLPPPAKAGLDRRQHGDRDGAVRYLWRRG